jgi:hypothetical protein
VIGIKPQQVFEFSKDQKDFWFSQRFEAGPKAANCPFVIMLIGNTRTGKSTRGNQM